MSVVGFRLLPNDLTASMHGNRKMDQNGETAAIIKIITREHGFTYDLGALGHVAVDESHPGEIWLYVPHGVTHLTINHATIGRLSRYVFPVSINQGNTYELPLDIGTGRYVTIGASRAGADIEVDGQYVGKASVYNHYLNFGRHTLKAANGRFEGTTDIYVSSNDGKEGEQRVLTVEMQDMSHLYGDVTVTVDNRADIYYAGRLVGTGRWNEQLKEGTHEVETRKADCDPVKTQFTVVAGRHQDVSARPPLPHTGWLHLYTRPRNVTAVYNGSHPIDLTEVQTLPVGTYQLSLSRKGYVTRNVNYTVHRDQTTRDTIQLERVTYVKPLAFYFGGAYTLRSLSGVSGILGAVYHRHDLQASYTFGLAETDVVYWDGDMNTATRYKMQSLGLKYGYQFPLMRQLAITPQLGYSYNFLAASAATPTATAYADGTSSQALTIGVKLVLVPMQHLYLFVVPEYMLALSQDKNFKAIDASSGLGANGFAAHAGVLVSF